MPTRWETFPIEVKGGLVSNVADLQQGLQIPGSARTLKNFEPAIKGGNRRINGYEKFDSTVVTGTGQVFGVGYFDGSAIAVRNGAIYESTGSGWSSIVTGRTHTTKHRFTIINLDGTRKLLGVDGSNYPYSWNGSAFAAINASAAIEGTDHVVEFKDHVFYAVDDLITYSIPFDETDFTVADGAGSFRVKGDVTGMIVFRERLFIFTEDTIDVLDGADQTTWALTSVSEDVGCVASDTIQEVAGDVAFLSSDGVRLLGATDRIGDFSNQVASKKIQDEFINFQANYSQFSSTVIRGKSQYRIFGFTSGRGAATTESYLATQFEAQNPEAFEWGKLVGFEVYSSDSKIYNGTEYVIFCGEETGYVYRMDMGDDFDGTTIESGYFTPYLSFSDPLLRKTLYKVHMFFDPEGDIDGSLTINFDFNNAAKIQPMAIAFSASGGGATYGTGVYGTSTYSAAPSAIVEFNVIGSGLNASLEFAFTAANAPFIIDTILIEYANEEKY